MALKKITDQTDTFFYRFPAWLAFVVVAVALFLVKKAPGLAGIIALAVCVALAWMFKDTLLEMFALPVQ